MSMLSQSPNNWLSQRFRLRVQWRVLLMFLLLILNVSLCYHIADFISEISPMRDIVMISKDSTQVFNRSGECISIFRKNAKLQKTK